MERKAFPFEVKQVSDKGDFEGYASVFNNEDLGGDIVAPGAFDETLAEWAAKKMVPPCLWMHWMDNPVAELEEIKVDSIGLYVAGYCWVDENRGGRAPIEDAKKAHNQMMSKGPKGMSFGYNVLDFDMQDGARILTRVKLWEVSHVIFGMNPLAGVTNAKSNETIDKRILEYALRDAGLSQRQAKAFISAGLPALDRAKIEDDGQPTDDEMKSVISETLQKMRIP